MIDWLTSTAFTAFGAPTTWAEVLGFATGLVNVALLVRQHLRRWMTSRFAQELGALGVPHLVLTGSCRRRLRAAIRATDDLLARGWEFEPPLSAAAGQPIGK